jgi:hypothetical protein
MIEDKVIYTDGHDVTVTSSDFKVRNTMYKLNGIVKHGLTRLRANRVPGILLFILGGALIALSLLDYFPQSWDFRLGETTIVFNVFGAWLGAAIALIGTIQVIAERERYALRIATAEGEKDVVVSKRKEYISQIVDALNEAYRQVDFRPVYHTDRIESV